jgi:NTE family protein
MADIGGCDESSSAVGPEAMMAGATRKIALALQGGGSHGAFTWGVLDRLLEDDTIEIIGVTGTSAGAMNAICLADGLAQGGPEQARRQLRAFWEAVGKMPGVGSLLWWLRGETLAHMHIEQTPPYMMMDAVRRNLTPDEFNPGRLNPLRDVLAQMIDFDRLRDKKDLIVQVCATNVRTARRRVFSNEDIDVDAVIASATLPDLFPAVEIDGQKYWDGGYSGNPAMTALIQRLPKCDFIIVRIDPVVRKEMPATARDIHDRMTELSFNTTFWMELSAIGAVLSLVEEGELDRERFGRFFFHAIEASEELEKIPPSTKLNNAPAFLDYLFDLGRRTADGWIAKHGADLGRKSTIDLTKLLPVVAAEHPAHVSASIPLSGLQALRAAAGRT